MPFIYEVMGGGEGTRDTSFISIPSLLEDMKAFNSLKDVELGVNRSIPSIDAVLQDLRNMAKLKQPLFLQLHHLIIRLY